VEKLLFNPVPLILDTTIASSAVASIQKSSAVASIQKSSVVASIQKSSAEIDQV